MEAATIDDPVFGELAWDRVEHAWLGKARLDDLLELGAALRDTPGRFIRDDYDPQKLFHKGAFRLVVRPGDGQPQTPPSHEQRAAWRTFFDNRARIVGELLDRARAAYVRQRPARLYWWTEMYGGDDPLLPEALPDIQTVGELRKLVRPHRFVVWESRQSHPPPLWIAIQFDAAWDRGSGFAALVRGDQLVKFGSHELAESLPPAHPKSDATPFERALVHFEPFARLRCVVDERERYARYRRDPAFRPAPSWDFIEGNFELEADSPDGQIAAQQVEAFNAFMRDPQHTADVVLDAILGYYRQVLDNYHRGYEDPEEADRLMPPIDSRDGLRDLITFQTMRISTPDDGRGEPPFIGLGFACSWDEEHGLYVRWRDGAVEEVGGVETIL